jgi:putative acetyltransferase
VTIESAGGTIAVQGLAPLAVLPAMQKQGIGSMFDERALDLLKAAGHKGVIVLGRPEYYPRFGFVPAVPAASGADTMPLTRPSWRSSPPRAG